MSQTSENITPKKLKRRRIFFYSSIALLISFTIAWFILDRWAKGHGFSGAGDFVKTVTVNYWTSFNAEYETVELTMSESDFLKLSEQREKHLEKGMITKVEDRYVPAIITANGKKVKCRIRLKGHMTDHLQNNKWSFRVKTVKGDSFKGMRIFSLMHPGTRNYIYEWIYHQLLKQEGIATVRYSFLNLKVNGESWGIYAVEENFATELITHNDLPDGPIIGFNPDIYWFARLNEHERKQVDLSNMRFFGTFPEAYDEDEWLKNKENQKVYAEALTQFSRFINGEITTSQTFDIEKLARFHAVLDLVGGQFSLDWSDVKYYYNPVTQKIEPVGYESFSVRNTEQLSGAFRYRSNSENNSEWHDRLFSDPEFFAAYVKNLKRISKPEYLNKFFNDHNKELKNNLAILWAEFPYKKLLLDGYYNNQENIKTLLRAPQVPAFYLEEATDDSLIITVGCTGSLPVEIKSILIDKERQKLSQPVVFSSRKKNEIIYYQTISLPFKKDDKFDKEKIEVALNIPGDAKETTVKVKPVKLLSSSNEFKSYNEIESKLSDFNFLNVDEEKKQITFINGEHVLDKDLVIPAGYSVLAVSPFSLNIINNALFVSRSPIIFSGSEEDPIRISSSDSTGKGILLVQIEGKSSFNFVDFIGLGIETKKSDIFNSSVTIYESESGFSNCNFSANSFEGIKAIRSKVNVTNTYFNNFKSSNISALFSELMVTGSEFNSRSKNGIDLSNSKATMKNVKIRSALKSINAANASSVDGNNIVVSDGEIGIVSTDKSKVTVKNFKISGFKIGLKAEKKSDVYGPAQILITGFKSSDVKNLKESDNKSKIEIK